MDATKSLCKTFHMRGLLGRGIQRLPLGRVREEESVEKKGRPFIRGHSACAGGGYDILATVEMCCILAARDGVSCRHWVPGAGGGDTCFLTASLLAFQGIFWIEVIKLNLNYCLEQ